MTAVLILYPQDSTFDRNSKVTFYFVNEDGSKGELISGKFQHESDVTANVTSLHT